MAFWQSNMNADEEQLGQFVDPRMLTVASGLGVDDPNYNIDATTLPNDGGANVFQLDPSLEFNLDLDFCQGLETDNLGEDLRLPNYADPMPENSSFELSTTPPPPPPPQQQSHHPAFGPEMETFASKRPTLKLDTAPPRLEPATPEPTPGRTPTTPEIRVFAAPVDLGISFDGNVPQYDGRARRNSSPQRSRGRGRGRNRAGRAVSLSQGPVAMRHLSPTATPMTTESFVMEHGYHPGDRLAHSNSQSYATAGPSISPPTLRRTPRSAPASQIAGPYYCDHDGCQDTGKPFDTPNELRKHQRKHIPKAARPHACTLCGKRFLFPKDVTRHMGTHTGEEHSCPVCGKALSRGDNVVRHMQQVHHRVMTPSTGESNTGNESFGAPLAQVSSSPRADSVASFDTPNPYYGSCPGTPLLPSPLIQANASFQQVVQPMDCGGAEDPFVVSPEAMVAAQTQLSPSYAPHMFRSHSDQM